MTSISILLILTLLCFAFAAVQGVRGRRRRRQYSADDLARVQRADRTLKRYVPRYLAIATGSTAGATLTSGEWLVGGSAAFLTVVLVLLVERRRREVLRDAGFELSKFGSAKIPSLAGSHYSRGSSR